MRHDRGGRNQGDVADETSRCASRGTPASGASTLCQRGVDGTTIADIATATGTAHGLVYHYFASKNDLLLAVLERFSFLEELRRLLVVSPDRPAVEVLTEIAVRFSALLQERADLLRLVSRESQTNPAVAAALGDVMAEGTRLIAGYLDARVAARRTPAA